MSFTRPTMTITLSEKDARFILEALHDMSEKWLQINQTATDEDVQAEYAMDLAVMHITQERFETAALEAFGPNVTEFSRVPIYAEKPTP